MGPFFRTPTPNTSNPPTLGAKAMPVAGSVMAAAAATPVITPPPRDDDDDDVMATATTKRRIRWTTKDARDSVLI
jgi:hypothetical protein